MSPSDELVRRAQAAGCEVSLSRRGYFKVVCPDGHRITVHRTPSDWRGIKNIRARLRQHGVSI